MNSPKRWTASTIWRDPGNLRGTQAVFRHEIRSGDDCSVGLYEKRVDSCRRRDFESLLRSCGKQRGGKGVGYGAFFMHYGDRRTGVSRRNGRRKNDVGEFPGSVLPSPYVFPRRRHGEATYVERREDSSFRKRRHDSDSMEIPQGSSAENVGIASIIQYRVGYSEFFEQRQRQIREKPLPYRSKIQTHSFCQLDARAGNPHVFKIRPIRFVQNGRLEYA